MKNQSDLIRSAHIQMIPDDSFKPHPARLRTIEYPGIGNLELPERHLISISGLPLRLGENRGKRSDQRVKKLRTADGPSRSQTSCNLAASLQLRNPLSRAS